MPTLRLLPDFEDAVRQINGVRAASVVTGPDAIPTEIHVLAATGKAPKQVVRDVQSLALARFDLDVDHRIVSVVQIGDDQPIEGAAEVAAEPRRVRRSPRSWCAPAAPSPRRPSRSPPAATSSRRR